jgi:class 3 adenylate cyclase
MERQISFCTTSDGVRIAFAISGEGLPVLFIPQWASHVELDLFPTEGPLQFIHYDKRGTGLSDRHLGDYSIETRLRDAEAVVDAVGIERFAVMGASEGAPVAIAYAAAHPARVSRLVLNGGFALGDRTDDERQKRAALVALVRADWGMGSAALTSVFFDEPIDPATRAYWDRLQRDAVSPDDAAAMWQAVGDVDVRHLLPKIVCPTLIVHGRGDRAVPFERAREMAAGINGARIVSDEGGHKSPQPARAAAVGKFLLEDEFFQKASPRQPTGTGTAIILFADIVDSTALTEGMGDAAFRERARALDASLRQIIASAGGTAIDGKLLGDGVLATFPAASQAIDAALRCGAAGDDGGLPLHLGIHAGDVIREADAHGRANVFGGAVNIASRISGLSAPGEVLVSDVVRALARTSASVTFEDRGEHALKGVGEPQRVYAVRKGPLDGA